MKNLFRSDSAMGNSKFIWQQSTPNSTPAPSVSNENITAEEKASITEKIKELGEATMSGNETLKTTTKTQNDLDALEANENNSEAPIMEAIRRVNELILKYLKSGVAEHTILEKDIMDAINEAVGGAGADQDIERAWLSSKINIKFEALTETGEFGAEDAIQNPGTNETNESQGEFQEVRSRNPELTTVLGFYYLDLDFDALGINETNYRVKLPNALFDNFIKGDLENFDFPLFKERVEKEATGDKQSQNALQGVTNAFKSAFGKLSSRMPDALNALQFTTKEVTDALTFEKLVKDKLKELLNKASFEDVELMTKKLNFKENIEEIDRLYKTVPAEYKNEKYEDKYYEQLKNGLTRKEFPQWLEDDSGIQGLEKIGHFFSSFMTRIAKLFKSMGFFKEWATKYLDDKEAEKGEDNPNQAEINAELKILKDKQEQAETKKTWAEATPEQKDALEKFNTDHGERFSFEVAKFEVIETDEGVEEQGEIYSEQLEIEHIKAIHNENAGKLELQPKIVQVLSWAEGKGGKIGKEQWLKVVEAIQTGKAGSIKFKADGTLDLVNGNMQMEGVVGNIVEIKEWNDEAFEELSPAEGSATKVFIDNRTKFATDVEFKNIPEGLFVDEDRNRSFEPALNSLLKLGADQWNHHTITGTDLEKFDKYCGNSAGFRRGNFSNQEDTFYTDFTKGGRLFFETDAVGTDGKWFTNLSKDEINTKAPNAFAVGGTGRMITKDYKFVSIKAFFTFLENGSNALD